MPYQILGAGHGGGVRADVYPGVAWGRAVEETRGLC